MKKYILYAVIFLVTHLLFFLGGGYFTQRMLTAQFVNQFKELDAEVMLGRYIAYRNISVEINAKKYDRAKCEVDMIASAMLDGIKDCMLEESCKAIIESQVKEKAPEILGEYSLPFSYMETHMGIKSCN